MFRQQVITVRSGLHAIEKLLKALIMSGEGNVRQVGKEINGSKVHRFEMHGMKVRLLSDFDLADYQCSCILFEALR